MLLSQIWRDGQIFSRRLDSVVHPRLIDRKFLVDIRWCFRARSRPFEVFLKVSSVVDFSSRFARSVHSQLDVGRCHIDKIEKRSSRVV